MTEGGLQRRLSLPLLTLYGLGTTIGAGIYALLGEVAAEAGAYSPWAFLGASLLAATTAFSFAELSARFPRSAGEAVYVREGLRSVRLALVVGLLVATAGIVSSATLANGFVGYAAEFVDLPHAAGVLLVLGGLGAVAAWGIGESVALAAVITVIEIAGLVVVIGFAIPHLPGSDAVLPLPTLDAPWAGVLSASLLAFYAFLGFEDMVNVAEEVRDVRRTLPRAILLTLTLTTVLYVMLSGVVLLVVPPQVLAESDAPLTLVARRTGGPDVWISAIGVVAMVNGVLIQIVMASRVLYGLASQGSLPAALARIHPRRHTPLLATAIAVAAAAGLALWLPLAPLARITSLVTLVIFALVNLALLRVKRSHPQPGPGIPVYPAWLPATGLVATLGMLAAELIRRL